MDVGEQDRLVDTSVAVTLGRFRVHNQVAVDVVVGNSSWIDAVLAGDSAFGQRLPWPERTGESAVVEIEGLPEVE